MPLWGSFMTEFAHEGRVCWLANRNDKLYSLCDRRGFVGPIQQLFFIYVIDHLFTNCKWRRIIYFSTHGDLYGIINHNCKWRTNLVKLNYFRCNIWEDSESLLVKLSYNKIQKWKTKETTEFVNFQSFMQCREWVTRFIG